MFDHRFAIQVVDSKGKPYRIYTHEAQQFLCGKPTDNYTLRLTNNSSERILAAVTVDGLSIMDGKPGSLKKPHGYVLYPHQNIEVPGWRLDNNEVAAFKFGQPGESYAAKKGEDTANVGVIGCAFFRERQRRQPPQPYSAVLCGCQPRSFDVGRGVPMAAGPIGSPGPKGPFGSSAGGMGFAGASPESYTSCALPQNTVQQGIGTEFGERRSHNVTETVFNEERSPIVVLTIFYNDAENLRKMGIRLDDDFVARPNPFPADAGVGCQPPYDWRG